MNSPLAPFVVVGCARPAAKQGRAQLIVDGKYFHAEIVEAKKLPSMAASGEVMRGLVRGYELEQIIYCLSNSVRVSVKRLAYLVMVNCLLYVLIVGDALAEVTPTNNRQFVCELTDGDVIKSCAIRSEGGLLVPQGARNIGGEGFKLGGIALAAGEQVAGIQANEAGGESVRKFRHLILAMCLGGMLGAFFGHVVPGRAGLICSTMTLAGLIYALRLY